jgi:hypothetical protein
MNLGGDSIDPDETIKVVSVLVIIYSGFTLVFSFLGILLALGGSVFIENNTEALNPLFVSREMILKSSLYILIHGTIFFGGIQLLRKKEIGRILVILSAALYLLMNVVNSVYVSFLMYQSPALNPNLSILWKVFAYSWQLALLFLALATSGGIIYLLSRPQVRSLCTKTEENSIVSTAF